MCAFEKLINVSRLGAGATNNIDKLIVFLLVMIIFDQYHVLIDRILSSLILFHYKLVHSLGLLFDSTTVNSQISIAIKALLLDQKFLSL